MTPLFATKQQAGERAFERLYKAHVHDVYRYALMVLRNPADAEDVAQTTFMNAYRALERGEQPRAPRHWLIAIAHNVCRSRLRDLGRRPQQVELEDYHVATTDDGGDGVDPQELVEALGVLSFNQRSALVMRELEGRTYAEIAEILEISPSAVETLLFRARRAVREQLEGTLSCGEAELSLSKQLDGALDADGKRRLRAHLRSCKECAGLARRERARSAALRGLAFPLPGSLASWGGGAAAVGTGIAVKAAALVAATVAAAGVAHQAAEAVSPPASNDRANVRNGANVQSERPRASIARDALIGSPAKSKTTKPSSDGAKKSAPTAAAADRTRGASNPGGAEPVPAPGTPKSPLPGVEVPTLPLPVGVPDPPALPPVPVDPPALPPLPVPDPPALPVPLPPPPPLETPPLPPPPPLPSVPSAPTLPSVP